MPSKRKPRSLYRKGKAKAANTSKKVFNDMRFKQKEAGMIKPEPFPRTLYTRCKYGRESGLAIPANNTAVADTYRLNSINDPRFAIGGQTVTGHAALSAIYDAYWVMGAKVEVRFFNPDLEGVRVGCSLRINSQNPTAGQNTTWLSQQPLTYMGGLADSGKQTKYFSFYVQPWQLQSCTKLEYMSSSTLYASKINTNPQLDNCLFDVFAIGTNATSANVRYAIKITYYTKLYERKGLTATGTP